MADDLHTAIERAKETFGLTELKPKQVEVITAFVSGKHVFVSLLVMASLLYMDCY